MNESCIMVYLGTDVQCKLTPNPIKPGTYLLNAERSELYIDGELYGKVERPVSKIYVSPGQHRVEVVAAVGNHVASSGIKLVYVRESSNAMLSFKAVDYMKGIAWEYKEFNDVSEFQRHTGQYF